MSRTQDDICHCRLRAINIWQEGLSSFLKKIAATLSSTEGHGDKANEFITKKPSQRGWSNLPSRSTVGICRSLRDVHTAGITTGRPHQCVTQTIGTRADKEAKKFRERLHARSGCIRYSARPCCTASPPGRLSLISFCTKSIEGQLMDWYTQR